MGDEDIEEAIASDINTTLLLDMDFPISSSSLPNDTSIFLESKENNSKEISSTPKENKYIQLPKRLPTPISSSKKNTKNNTQNDKNTKNLQISKFFAKNEKGKNLLSSLNSFSTLNRKQSNTTKFENKSFTPVFPSSFPSLNVSNKNISLPVPDELKTVFNFGCFNSMQSSCYNVIYHSDKNVVISSPPGSGKTVLFELAILRLVSELNFISSSFKIIYIAPTKALCSERHRDWSKKFAFNNLKVGLLTGDTETFDLQNVKTANIIITTPEKWDSTTRKWKNNKKLINLIKLLLIDEFHILNSNRGSVLDVVVSRMKTIAPTIRIIALSANILNSNDVALWVGTNDGANNDSLFMARKPAELKIFNENARPIKLEKFVYGYPVTAPDNAFLVDRVLDMNTVNVFHKHFINKPVLIFCPTRMNTVTTAKLLADEYNKKKSSWKLSDEIQELTSSFQDAELKKLCRQGVAFHHAGLNLKDRILVEDLFRKKIIYVLCSTSTLSVGINMPAHMVIIKNTSAWTELGSTEYSTIDLLQMMGRAGRMGYDTSGICVIMTTKEKKSSYEKLVFGKEIIESFLHFSLLKHLNVEISLGTVSDLNSAIRWLKSTFLYLRMRANPLHYRIENISLTACVDDKIKFIAKKDLNLLSSAGFISQINKKEGSYFQCTEYGETMAKYCLSFNTSNLLLSSKSSLMLPDILELVCQAEEFKDIRLRKSEHTLFKEINSKKEIKFPFKEKIVDNWEKISLIIQFELSGMNYPSYQGALKLQRTFNIEKNIVFKQLSRITRYFYDIKMIKKDGISVKNIYEFIICCSSKCWMGSPYMLKQINDIRSISVSRFMNHNINSFDKLRKTPAKKIESILNVNPGKGDKILNDLGKLPEFDIKLRNLTYFKGVNDKNEKGKSNFKLTIKFDVEIKVCNENFNLKWWSNHPLTAVILTISCSGELIDVHRIPAYKLKEGIKGYKKISLFHKFSLEDLNDMNTNLIESWIYLDEIVGFEKSVGLKLESIPQAFKPLKLKEAEEKNNIASVTQEDEFYLSDSIEQALYEFYEQGEENNCDNTISEEKNINKLDINYKNNVINNMSTFFSFPRKRKDDKWDCNHICKDKNKCKHRCCNEGLDHPPKLRTMKKMPDEDTNSLNSPGVKNYNDTKFLDLCETNHNDIRSHDQYGAKNYVNTNTVGLYEGEIRDDTNSVGLYEEEIRNDTNCINLWNTNNYNDTNSIYLRETNNSNDTKALNSIQNKNNGKSYLTYNNNEKNNDIAQTYKGSFLEKYKYREVNMGTENGNVENDQEKWKIDSDTIEEFFQEIDIEGYNLENNIETHEYPSENVLLNKITTESKISSNQYKGKRKVKNLLDEKMIVKSKRFKKSGNQIEIIN